MTAPQLARLCRLWQRRLRLQDWKVTARFVRPEELDGDCGQIEYDPSEMAAEIRIRVRQATEDDPEPTLVHELLHLRLVPFGIDDSDEKQAAMNLLADAFIRAYPPRARA